MYIFVEVLSPSVLLFTICIRDTSVCHILRPCSFMLTKGIKVRFKHMKDSRKCSISEILKDYPSCMIFFFLLCTMVMVALKYKSRISLYYLKSFISRRVLMVLIIMHDVTLIKYLLNIKQET